MHVYMQSKPNKTAATQQGKASVIIADVDPWTGPGYV